MKLMIVDDSNVIRSKISRIAQADGYEQILIVGLARNGAEAIKIAKSAHPDVVTMDLTMPEMDGLESIRELMQLFPKINILVVSALDDKATAIAALRLGARGFIGKPFTEEELRLALYDVMDTELAKE